MQRVVLLIQRGLNDPDDMLTSEHLSKKKFSIKCLFKSSERCIKDYYGFFRDIGEKEDVISLGKVDSR